MMAWFEIDPARAKAEVTAARQHMSDVDAYPTEDIYGKVFVILGRMTVSAVIDGTEVRLGDVRLRLIYPGDFPTQGVLPEVYDDRGAFPHEPEWHMFSTGRFCLGLLKPGDGDHAACFPVYSFDKLAAYLRVLLAQLFVFKSDPTKWPGDEYSHGLDGFREAGFLPLADRNRLCPCRSGKRFRDCCARKLGSASA